MSFLAPNPIIIAKLAIIFVTTLCYFIYFVFLGAAKNLKLLRNLMEQRFGVKGRTLRIEKAKYSEDQGITTDGCPLANYVIRR